MKRDEPVAEVMTKHPRSVQLTDKIGDVRAALADRRLHHLPVVDGEQLVGMISSTDLLEFGFEPRDSHTNLDDYLNEHFSIPQIMQTNLVTVPSDSTVRDAARALTTGSTSRSSNGSTARGSRVYPRAFAAVRRAAASSDSSRASREFTMLVRSG